MLVLQSSYEVTGGLQNISFEVPVLQILRGRLVEIGATRQVIDNAQHPYTQALLAAVPDASLDRPLDFNKLSAGRASEPTKWPAPYRLAPGEVPVMIEVSPGHLVCAPGLSTSLEEAA